MQVNVRPWQTAHVALSNWSLPEEWVSMKFGVWLAGFSDAMFLAWQVSQLNGFSIWLWQTRQSAI